MTLRIEYRANTRIPVEVEGITPDIVRELPLAQIEKITIFHGNQKLVLADMFAVSGDPSDSRMEFVGDLAGVHWIGAKMSDGEIHIEGDVGRHVGSEMAGGSIHVSGDASDWVGGEMHGGLIHVRGRAGHLIGAAYRGSPRGMTGGTLLIEGTVGNEIGHTMRRGLIAIGGDCGDIPGFNMIAGTILVLGNTGIRPGAGMRRGTIALLGSNPPLLLPTFRHACEFSPDIMGMLLGELKRLSFPVPEPLWAARYHLHHGDLIEGGRGEILSLAS